MTAMRFANLACLDDLTRDAFWPAKEFIYDLVRTPIWHATGLDIARSPRHGHPHHLKLGFSDETFRALCGQPATPWQAVYDALPAAAADYLGQHLLPDTLYIGYEMPPWLTGLLQAAGHAWLDIRLAPLRFGADLYLALASNQAPLHAALRRHAVGAPEVLCEAGLMSARVRYRRRYHPDLERLDNVLVWIGQTEEDSSLIDQGRFVRVDDHADTLRDLAATRRLVYRGHPLGGSFGERERARIERIVGQPVPCIDEDTYELLAMDDDVAFVALSSGTLQEAECFGKQAVALHRPVCELAFDDSFDPQRHTLVHAHVFMSEPLWAALLTDAPPREGAVVLPARPNHLRELHNTWWGYATSVLRHSEFQREAFRLHGNGTAALPGRDTGGTDPLAKQLAMERQRVDDLRLEVDGLKEALRVLMRHGRAQATAPWAAEAAGA